jgi:hypothetical protein
MFTLYRINCVAAQMKLCNRINFCIVVRAVPDSFLRPCHCNVNTNSCNFGFYSGFKMESNKQNLLF